MEPLEMLSELLIMIKTLIWNTQDYSVELLMELISLQIDKCGRGREEMESIGEDISYLFPVTPELIQSIRNNDFRIIISQSINLIDNKSCWYYEF